MVVSRAFLQILHENASNLDPSQDTEKTNRANGSSDSSLAINDFLFSLNIDNINLVKLLQYIKESKIMYKVSPASLYDNEPSDYFSLFPPFLT